jgi:hypothetical protein
VRSPRPAPLAQNGLMGLWLGRTIGAVLVLVGGLWTLQGFGVVGGSFMTGSTACW